MMTASKKIQNTYCIRASMIYCISQRKQGLLSKQAVAWGDSIRIPRCILLQRIGKTLKKQIIGKHKIRNKNIKKNDKS